MRFCPVTKQPGGDRATALKRTSQMENEPLESIAPVDIDTMTPALLTERHLAEWLRLLDYLQDTHAPTSELTYCRNQVTRLQLDLYQLLRK